MILRYRSREFYARIGRFEDWGDGGGELLWSAAARICTTWRSHLAWHLARALEAT